MDRIAAMNKEVWEAAVRRGEGNAKPSLNLDVRLVERYARGELDPIPDIDRGIPKSPVQLSHDLYRVFPPSVLQDVAGKDVLCLACGGGQQSPLFALLGARVTVLDLAEGQLEGDRAAAEHYGYEIRTVQGDMRDLSCFAEKSFDVVCQVAASSWIPDIRQVYEQVARVLRSGGLYRADFCNPVSEFRDHPDAQNGEVPLSVKEMVYRHDGKPDDVQFRHDLSEVFNGLLDTGFDLERVFDRGHWYVVLARRQ
jgi:SAM-dependent methyltransferase